MSNATTRARLLSSLLAATHISGTRHQFEQTFTLDEGPESIAAFTAGIGPSVGAQPAPWRPKPAYLAHLAACARSQDAPEDAGLSIEQRVEWVRREVVKAFGDASER